MDIYYLFSFNWIIYLLKFFLIKSNQNFNYININLIYINIFKIYISTNNIFNNLSFNFFITNWICK